MSTLQQLYDVTLKLELAQQEIEIIKLEKIEYEKEINRLKRENEEILQENNAYIENEKLERQHILLLHSVATNTIDINSYNSILNKEIFKYKKLVKSLTLQNAKLQKENEAYIIRLEQFNQQKQQTHEIYMNNKLQLENTIKQLQNECNTLQDEINSLGTLQIQYEKRNVANIDSDEKQYELLAPLRMPSLQKGMYSLTLNHDMISRRLSGVTCTENIETQIISNPQEFIVCPENEIIEQYQNGLSTTIEAKIDEIIDTAKGHINKLRKRIKFLQQENKELMLKINKVNSN